ncbi:uncharacterized protein LOC112177435 [Rosa chinensis]|uniref:uncharacterized protein LOC112177435 n=1 Tax=Rosa chinensis TaxID=74649 RepID=UPI000D08EF86|nr:uncharacterized protein LOC112177435 [Rosa chinensis]
MDYDLPEEGIEAFYSLYERLSSYLVEKEAYDRVATLEIVNEEFSDQEEEEEEIQIAPAALDDTPPMVRDPTEKVNLGTTDEPIEVAISAYLEPSEKQRLVDLLLEFKDCFAEKYEDMPVPVRKKSGKIRVCVDYRDLNLATPKDVYPMPVADMLVDAVAGHELLSFMDGTAGYHQIPVAEEDRHKTAFRCPGFAGVFEYVVYIDDVVVKSKKSGDHFTDLRKVFERMQLHKLKMNPAKCVFGVQARDFLGFIVHQRGIEVPEDKANAVINASPHERRKSYSDYWYVPQKAVEGQAIADFLAHHPMLDVLAVRDLEVVATTLDRPDLVCLPEYAVIYQATVSLQPWVLYFDGSRTDTLAGAGVVLENPAGDRFSYSFQLEFQCTNNQAEYEALIIGLEVLLEMGIRDVQILGDSLLVINQLCNEFRCNSFTLVPYGNRALNLLVQFDNIHLEYIPREQNFAANELAQLATGVTLRYGVREIILKVERRTLPSWMVRRDPPDDTSVATLEPIDVDWRIPLIAYLKQRDPTSDRKIRFLALNYFLRGDELRRRGEDGIDFRCVYGCEAKQLMREVHSGICGAHQAGPKMRWLLRRHGYFWPSILKDCIAFAFMGGEVDKLAKEWGIHFVHSSPYYAQSNGQAEASNKIIITLLKKMLEANPRQWHETLYETLWAYRTSKRNPTATTPYALMFGHDAVLPLEVNVQSLRVQEQHHLIGEDYVQAMWQEHEDLSEKRLEALDSLVMEKQRVARAYDKRTRGRNYSEGELVWKAVLPLGEKLDGRGKWTPRWEGPYIIHKILGKGAFHLKDLDGDVHHNPINGRYLKK